MKNRFRQSNAPRTVNKRVLILCEGSVTEPQYFNALKTDKSNSDKLSALRIVIHPSKFTSARELVEEAKRLKEIAHSERNQFDAVWVVVDHDNYPKHDEAFKRADDINIKIAFSSPCFEFWFLLHFVYSTAQHANFESVNKILKTHLPDYEKTSVVYNILKTNQEKAIEHSKKIIMHHSKTNELPIWKLNPYTNVGELVEFLLNL